MCSVAEWKPAPAPPAEKSNTIVDPDYIVAVLETDPELREIVYRRVYGTEE